MLMKEDKRRYYSSELFKTVDDLAKKLPTSLQKTTDVRRLESTPLLLNVNIKPSIKDCINALQSLQALLFKLLSADIAGTDEKRLLIKSIKKDLLKLKSERLPQTLFSLDEEESHNSDGNGQILEWGDTFLIHYHKWERLFLDALPHDADINSQRISYDFERVIQARQREVNAINQNITLKRALNAFTKFKALVKKYLHPKRPYPKETAQTLFSLYRLFQAYLIEPNPGIELPKDMLAHHTLPLYEKRDSIERLFSSTIQETDIVIQYNQALRKEKRYADGINAIAPLPIEDQEEPPKESSPPDTMDTLLEGISKDEALIFQMEDGLYYLKLFKTLLLKHTQCPINCLEEEKKEKIAFYMRRLQTLLPPFHTKNITALIPLISSKEKCETLSLKLDALNMEVCKTIKESKENIIKQNALFKIEHKGSCLKPLPPIPTPGIEHDLHKVTHSLRQYYPDCFDKTKIENKALLHYLSVYRQFFSSVKCIQLALTLSSETLYEKARTNFDLAVADYEAFNDNIAFPLVYDHITALKHLFIKHAPFLSDGLQSSSQLLSSPILHLPNLIMPSFMQFSNTKERLDKLTQKVRALKLPITKNHPKIIQSIIEDCYVPLLLKTLEYENANQARPGSVLHPLSESIENLHQSLIKALPLNDEAQSELSYQNTMWQEALNTFSKQNVIYAQDSNFFTTPSFRLKNLLGLLKDKTASIETIKASYQLAYPLLEAHDKRYHKHFLRVEARQKLYQLKNQTRALIKKMSKDKCYQSKQHFILKECQQKESHKRTQYYLERYNAQATYLSSQALGLVYLKNTLKSEMYQHLIEKSAATVGRVCTFKSSLNAMLKDIDGAYQAYIDETLPVYQRLETDMRQCQIWLLNVKAWDVTDLQQSQLLSLMEALQDTNKSIYQRQASVKQIIESDEFKTLFPLGLEAARQQKTTFIKRSLFRLDKDDSATESQSANTRLVPRQ